MWSHCFFSLISCYSLLLTCSSHFNFFCTFSTPGKLTSQNRCTCCYIHREHSPQIFTWFTPLLASCLLLKCHLLSKTSTSPLKTANSSFPSPDLFLIVFTSATDILYILVIHFVSFSSSEYKIHEGRDFCL